MSNSETTKKPINTTWIIVGIISLVLIIALTVSYSKNNNENNDNIPQTLTLTTKNVTSNSVDLEWSEITDSVEYQIYRNDSSFIVVIDKEEYQDYSLLPSTQYSYYIKAILTDGSSIKSNVVSITTTNPSQSDFYIKQDITALSENSITISWNNVPSATFYKIYRNQIEIDTIESSDSLIVYVDSLGLQPDTQYQYMVVAFNDVNYSNPSNIITAYTLLSAPVPYINTDYSTQNSLQVEWEPITDAIGYEIVKTDLSNNNKTNFETNSSFFFDENLNSNSQYNYQVRAISAVNTSQYGMVNGLTLLESPVIFYTPEGFNENQNLLNNKEYAIHIISGCCGSATSRRGVKATSGNVLKSAGTNMVGDISYIIGMGNGEVFSLNDPFYIYNKTETGEKRYWTNTGATKVQLKSEYDDITQTNDNIMWYFFSHWQPSSTAWFQIYSDLKNAQGKGPSVFRSTNNTINTNKNVSLKLNTEDEDIYFSTASNLGSNETLDWWIIKL